MNKEEKEQRQQKALEEFGEEIVNEVKEEVKKSDPYSAYKNFIELEKYKQTECIDMLYFN